MRYSGVLIERKDGKFLFQLRDNKPSIANPNLWGLFGGGIKKNESPIRGAIREIKEELSIKLEESDLKLLIVIPLFASLIFIYKTKADKFKKATQREGQDMKYFSLDEITKQKNVIPILKCLLKIYKLFYNLKNSLR